MKKLLQIVAITAALLLCSSVASFADGNPTPLCTGNVCTGPL
jgi:hypothetical protein